MRSGRAPFLPFRRLPGDRSSGARLGGRRFHRALVAALVAGASLHRAAAAAAAAPARSAASARLAAAPPQTAQTPPAPVMEAIRRGTAAMRAGRGAEAEAELRRAVALAPQLPEAHLDLALVLARVGKLDEAVTAMREALALDPALPQGNMFLGIFLSQGGHSEEAAAALRQEIAGQPGNVEALTWLGMVELSRNHPERAVSPLDQASELAPDDLNLLELRGRAHREVARESYSRMARLEPDSWHVHRVGGELYAEDGRHAEAILEFQAAIKQQARNPDLYEELGLEYRSLNQLAEARSAFARELELGPTNPVAMYELGSTEIERGNTIAGIALLRQTLLQRPGEAVAQYYLGRGLAAEGKDAEALTWLEQSAASSGRSGEVAKRSAYELARIYRRLGRATDAARALAEYDRLRTQTEKPAAAAREDWRRLSAPATPASATPAPGSH